MILVPRGTFRAGQNPSGAPDQRRARPSSEVPDESHTRASRGGYDALRLVDIPPPQPRAGQALVHVTSAGVTPLGRTVLAGLHPRAAAPPLVPGNKGAGVVIEDPSGGERPFGLLRRLG